MRSGPSSTNSAARISLYTLYLYMYIGIKYYSRRPGDRCRYNAGDANTWWRRRRAGPVSQRKIRIEPYVIYLSSYVYFHIPTWYSNNNNVRRRRVPVKIIPEPRLTILTSERERARAGERPSETGAAERTGAAAEVQRRVCAADRFVGISTASLLRLGGPRNRTRYVIFVCTEPAVIISKPIR